MSSVIRRGRSIYREDGLRALLVRSAKKLSRETYCEAVSRRGEYSLAIGDRSVSFSAPSSTMVKRNRVRFNSEKGRIAELLGEIRPDDVVYDIGANTGLYSLFAAQQCPRGRVVAFEPYPPNIALLERDRLRNGIENVDVIDVALSDSVGTTEFSQPDEDDVGYGSSSIEPTRSGGTIEVPTTTGDRLIVEGEIPEPNVVKIDVEGAEPLVIEGLEDALSSSDCRLVYCEVHLPGVEYRPSVGDHGSSLDEIRSKLERFSFDVQEVPSQREAEVFLKARKS